MTGAPSSKTSYVVVGDGAGASKLKAIKEKNLETVDEDGFLDLIRDSEFTPDQKSLDKEKKEMEKIKQQAKELEEREKEEEKLRKRKEAALEGTGIAAKSVSGDTFEQDTYICRKAAPVSAQLWTTKYAPTNMKEICGNKAPVERLGKWLADWYVASFDSPSSELNHKGIQLQVGLQETRERGNGYLPSSLDLWTTGHRQDDRGSSGG